ncbi:MAG TPA: GrpB family protein [Candidatus Saccharimonadales bacterium]|nr:GrpB family protein [Candidatus Saccharimonadales bacterium]
MGDEPNDAPTAAEVRIREATIGEPERLDGVIELRPYDPQWPEQFRAEADRVCSALGARALRVEHVGSTSVPGLVAKPIIDMLLVVADSSDEAGYVPPMESAGYTLRIREPDWYEHRLFKAPLANVNLHVFSASCPEITRMLDFRDRLRADAEDRELYQRTKQQLASRQWRFVQEYADAKTQVIEAIVTRASRPRSDAR